MIKKWAGWLLLVLLAVAIKVFSLFPGAVEHYYSNGLYKFTSKLQRWLFGWIPFSVGDLLYAVVILFLLYKVVDLVKRVRRRQADKQYWLSAFRRLMAIILVVYVSFNLFWGLNYNRHGIAYQLGLSRVKVDKQDLLPVMNQLLVRVNSYDSLARLSRDTIAKRKYLFSHATQAYQLLSETHSDLSYLAPSVKSSMFGFIGNYLGYSGYYNPFSGEAQVNTAVPLFIQPFTTCHEIGHQLGYAKENEANFAGFLSAKSSTDPVFLYSVYFEMYNYGRPYLYLQDSLALRQLDKQLRPGVKNDLKELREFYMRHENPMEKAVDRLYGQYLKANQQPDGKITYSQVVVWLIAYVKKYGIKAL